MIRYTWAKMPCTWQTKPDAHAPIRKAETGAAIAAMKLYIGLCMKANYNANKEFSAPGMVRMSIDRLSTLVGISKPVTIAGIRLLEDWNLIQRHGGRPAVYAIVGYEKPPYWTRLPSRHLYDGGNRNVIRKLATMGNRGKTRLHALQMYLYLASILDKFSMTAKVAYPKICDVLGITRNEVSRAISMLVTDDLIVVRLAELTSYSVNGRPSNEYWLRGSTSDNIREAEGRPKFGGPKNACVNKHSDQSRAVLRASR